MKGLARFCKIFCFLFCMLAFPVSAFSAETWAIYWYLCGSDLETRAAAASYDVQEMLGAQLPDNVKVIFQTGGSRQWQSSAASPHHIGRFVYEGGEVFPVQELPQANMGDEATLVSFLDFCEKNFPADRKMFLFWDHGGGSIGGIAYDENFGNDSLSLTEIRSAFEKIYTPSAENPPFELIGFDACLMATLDTANTLYGFSKYMVASQELEPGNGWEYTGWLTQLGRNTSMSGAELGKVICDTYMRGCEELGTHDNATLSVVNLAKMPELTMVYNALGLEAIRKVDENEAFYAKLGRKAKSAENYMNSRSQGFTNMMDMGDFVSNLKGDLPEFTQILLDTLNETIVYQVSGPYRNPSGLSCYYPYDGQQYSFDSMLRIGNITSFLMLNGLQFGFIDADRAVKQLTRIYEEISAVVEASNDEDNNVPMNEPVNEPMHEPAAPDMNVGSNMVSSILGGMGAGTSADNGATANSDTGESQAAQSSTDFIALFGQASSALHSTVFGENTPANIIAMFSQASEHMFSSLVPLQNLDISELEDFAVRIGDEGEAILDLGAERIDFIDSVSFYLAYYSQEDDIILLLGKDADIISDWDKGIFKDNFRGVWASLDGYLVYLEITHADEEVNHYAVPVMLNGERCNLEVVYDFSKEEYRVLGARRVLDDNMADKVLIQLKAGDKITTIFRAMSFSGDDDDFQDVETEEFVLGETVVFEDVDMGDGNFMFMFEMTDVQNNTALSEAITIEVKNGEILYSEIE